MSMYVEPKLEKEAEENPNVEADVILTCDSYSIEFRPQLEEAGLKITDDKMALELGEGFIVCRLRLRDLEKVKKMAQKIADMKSLELDSEEKAIEGDESIP